MGGIPSDPYFMMCGDWREELVAVHGPGGLIASGLTIFQAKPIVDELNRLVEGGGRSTVCFPPPEQEVEPELAISVEVDCHPVDLAAWIRRGGDAFTPMQAWQIATIMVHKKETWRPDYDSFNVARENPYCRITVTDSRGTTVIKPDGKRQVLEQVAQELKERYGFPEVCEVYQTLEEARAGLHTTQVFGVPVPFVEGVIDDWDHLGVTVIYCGDNNMGQWADAVLQPGLKAENFDEPAK